LEQLRRRCLGVKNKVAVLTDPGDGVRTDRADAAEAVAALLRMQVRSFRDYGAALDWLSEADRGGPGGAAAADPDPPRPGRGRGRAGPRRGDRRLAGRIGRAGPSVRAGSGALEVIPRVGGRGAADDHPGAEGLSGRRGAGPAAARRPLSLRTLFYI